MILKTTVEGRCYLDGLSAFNDEPGFGNIYFKLEIGFFRFVLVVLQFVNWYYIKESNKKDFGIYIC